MKRRDFLNLGASSALVAAVPFPRMAMAAKATKAPRTLYVWAVAMAHAGHPISEKTLGLALKVPSDQARALIGKLVSRGVVAAPNAAGVARAIKPAFQTLGAGSASGHVTVSRAPTVDAKTAVERLTRDLPSAPKPDAISPSDDCAPPEDEDATHSE